MRMDDNQSGNSTIWEVVGSGMDDMGELEVAYDPASGK